VDVAAVNPDGQPAIGPRQRIPITLAAFNEERLLIAEFTFEALGYLLRMSVDGRQARLE
jgi:hypothetical protein